MKTHVAFSAALGAIAAIATPLAAGAKSLDLSLSRTYGFSVQVPEGYAGTNENNTLFVTAPDKSVTLSLSFDTSPDDLQKDADALFDVFQKAMSLEPPAKRDATLSGLPGTAYLSHLTRNGVGLDFKLVIVKVDPAVIAIEYVIVRGETAAVQDAARSLEQSITLKGP